MSYWTYSQSTGVLFNHSTNQSWQCYSGHGDGLNNPQLQDLVMVGPIPQGSWEVVEIASDLKTGPVTWFLEWMAPIWSYPGRDKGSFRVHGDNAEVNHTASDGCVIAPHDCRVTGAVGDVIEVTP